MTESCLGCKLTCRRQHRAQASASAVSNLLDNAIRYTPRDGNIEVQVFDDDGVGVRISNSGAAHRSQDVPEAPAARPSASPPDTASSSTSVGTGLGLAIAREVAARHRGKLNFQLGSQTASVATLLLADIPPRLIAAV
jgi:two-component system, OmpR family, phosphate regulon sensor histidine kinase PhoR